MKLYQDPGWLRQKYWEEGCSLSEIGKVVGRDLKTIQRWMIKFDIPRRSQEGSLSERFWPKVDTRDENECWEWQAYRSQDGYGMIRVNHGVVERAHRVAWILTHGEIPQGKIVCHRCDNPSCCNPSHLYAGTHSDNMRDKIRRSPRDRQLKLTESEVREIRQLYASTDMLQRELAEQFSVSRAHISEIVTRKCWGWLDEQGR